MARQVTELLRHEINCDVIGIQQYPERFTAVSCLTKLMELALPDDMRIRAEIHERVFVLEHKSGDCPYGRWVYCLWVLQDETYEFTVKALKDYYAQQLCEWIDTLRKEADHRAKGINPQGKPVDESSLMAGAMA